VAYSVATRSGQGTGERVATRAWAPPAGVDWAITWDMGNHVGLLGNHVGLLGNHVGLLGNHVGLLGNHVGLPLRFGDGLVQPLDGCLPVVGVTVFAGDVLGVGVRDSGGFGGLVVEGPEVRSR